MILTTRQAGCGPALGILLLAIGAWVLLVHYHVIPVWLLSWWPVLVIAFGVWLLVRYYWQTLAKRRALAVPGIGPIIEVRSPWSPPVIPLLVIVLGVYWLLSNFKYVNLGVLIASFLILLGIGLVFRRRGAA